jgi:hypothetical protein
VLDKLNITEMCNGCGATKLSLDLSKILNINSK